MSRVVLALIFNSFLMLKKSVNAVDLKLCMSICSVKGKILVERISKLFDSNTEYLRPDGHAENKYQAIRPSIQHVRSNLDHPRYLSFHLSQSQLLCSVVRVFIVSLHHYSHYVSQCAFPSVSQSHLLLVSPSLIPSVFQPRLSGILACRHFAQYFHRG